ncbi:uncharacterized mitochondrial protein AtMg00810-like [Rhododendron vialii]|uniref:uncharacterized mitochondrial protein AtMg00810-like n=1 Tax=Rhododendron vialii TaxID=182163 RepID=UPI00265DB90C|nr:uncharacterized mitochondrial protein AtMg00810-like [Rhododendron vialii]
MPSYMEIFLKKFIWSSPRDLLTYSNQIISADSSLFICRGSHGIVLLLLYVDDIILTGDNSAYLKDFMLKLHQEFSMKDLGYLHYFLGIEVHQFPGGLLLNPKKYAAELLDQAQMGNCKPLSTPMVAKPSPPPNGNSPFPDPHLYRSIVGGLQYLTFTRPDLSFSVNYVCQFMHAPTEFHFQLVKRILRYVHGTLDQGLRLLSSKSLELYAFSDADRLGWLSNYSTVHNWILHLLGC